MFFSCEYSTYTDKYRTLVGRLLAQLLHVNTRSINLAMGLDMCNSNITGFQSASGGLLAVDLAVRHADFSNDNYPTR